MSELVLSRDAVRALDRRTIEEHGLPSLVLMENAGRACADEAGRMLGDADGPVLVLCGPGNNGGDGLVVARTLWNRGRKVRVFFVGPPERLAAGMDDFGTNLRLWRGLGQDATVVPGAEKAAGLAKELARAALVVDALFGTGLDRALGEPWTSAIGAVNSCGRPVLAVDLPSGLDADSGEVLGAAVKATRTVTFVAKKPGCVRGSGKELCGEIVVAEIGIPRPWIEAARQKPRRK